MASHEKHGRGYRGVYYVRAPDGSSVRRKTPTHPTKRAALQDARDQEAKLRSGFWFDPLNGRMTLAEYFESQWLPNRGVELTTRNAYRSQWKAPRHGIGVTFGGFELRQIRTSHVQGWVARMRADGLSPTTIEARFKTLQTMLAATTGASALRDGLINTNPCHGVEIPRRITRPVRIYEPNEVEALLDALDPWWIPVVLLDVETGMRWGELAGLKVSDFSLNYRSVTVNRVLLELPIAQTGNGTPYMFKDYPKEGPRAAPKQISLGSDAQACVTDLISARGLAADDLLLSMPNKAGVSGIVERPTFGKQTHEVPSGLWTSLRTQAWPGGLPISRTYFREHVWRRGIERAGLPYLKFHALRASHISWLLAGGVDLPAVMERVGHTQFTTTRRYSKAMEDADRRALEALDAVKTRYGVKKRFT